MKIIFLVFSIAIFMGFGKMTFAQVGEMSEPVPSVTVAAPQNGMRIIVDEEQAPQEPEVVAEEKSRRTVLFGLAAVLLVIVAIVAAMSLKPFGGRDK